jgi:hypothetical protein
MMIIRTSANLNKKIHVAPDRSLPISSNPFADWSTRLFTAGRAQYIVVTNTTSLYSVLIHGRGITDDDAFIRRAVTAIREQLQADDLSFLFERLIEPETNQIAFSKPLNQSVTGSLNDLVRQAKFSLGERGLSPFDAARMLARYPIGALGYAFPTEAFAAMSVEEQ